MAQKSLKDSEITILIEIEGQIHLMVTDRDKLDTIKMLVKASTDSVVPTEVTQQKLNNLLLGRN